MQTMKLNDEYFPLIEAGVKHNTIRLGEKNVSLGPLEFENADAVDEESCDSIIVDVFAVYKKCFCDLDELDAQGGGHESKHKMLRTIQGIYGRAITAFEPMTVVWFDTHEFTGRARNEDAE